MHPKRPSILYSRVSNSCRMSITGYSPMQRFVITNSWARSTDAMRGGLSSNHLFPKKNIILRLSRWAGCSMMMHLELSSIATSSSSMKGESHTNLNFPARVASIFQKIRHWKRCGVFNGEAIYLSCVLDRGNQTVLLICVERTWQEWTTPFKG